MQCSSGATGGSWSTGRSWRSRRPRAARRPSAPASARLPLGSTEVRSLSVGIQGTPASPWGSPACLPARPSSVWGHPGFKGPRVGDGPQLPVCAPPGRLTRKIPEGESSGACVCAACPSTEEPISALRRVDHPFLFLFLLSQRAARGRWPTPLASRPTAPRCCPSGQSYTCHRRPCSRWLLDGRHPSPQTTPEWKAGCVEAKQAEAQSTAVFPIPSSSPSLSEALDLEHPANAAGSAVAAAGSAAAAGGGGCRRLAVVCLEGIATAPASCRVLRSILSVGAGRGTCPFGVPLHPSLTTRR